MALFKADELRSVAYSISAKHNNAVQHESSVLPPAVRDMIMRSVEPLFKGISQGVWIREQEVNEAFESTGFSYWDAWDALPHKYVQESLLPLHSLINEARRTILTGLPDSILASLRILKLQAQERFEDVDEFLNGRLSRMSKGEWLRIYPNFSRDMEDSAINDELSWTIGRFVRPSQWAIERRDELERQHDLHN